jgi:hypothetical protein
MRRNFIMLLLLAKLYGVTSITEHIGIMESFIPREDGTEENRERLIVA